ncbi:MAG: putative pre-16S rRNA nuclease [Porticoccaceae bacterium]|nr:MAG: putative pre-16S rRNA nuclease [Porticoccaceae bacterium]
MARHLRVLAFDYGTRQVGVAVGQTLTQTATPVAVLRFAAERPDWPRLEALVREWQPDLLVVGLPLNMDGSEGPAAAAARRFARRLAGRTGVPAAMVDERLTTREARSHRPGRAPVDGLAAQLILETWLAAPERALPP